MTHNRKNHKSNFQRSKINRRALTAALGALLVLPLALPLGGCGRKSPPVKPKESKYPRDYPAQ